MVKEAEKYAEQDKKRKEKVELVNQANVILYSTEKAVADYGDKISATENPRWRKN